MPKNKGKGGKGKRKGKRNKGNEQEKREIRFKEFGEEYAQVRKILGNCRVEAYCFDGKSRLCHVPGKFRKRVWINKDDFILLGLRDYQDDKADIVHKYTTEEARLLRSWGEIPADKASFDDDGLSDGIDDFAEALPEEDASGDSEEEEENSEEDSEEDFSKYDYRNFGSKKSTKKDDSDDDQFEDL